MTSKTLKTRILRTICGYKLKLHFYKNFVILNEHMKKSDFIEPREDSYRPFPINNWEIDGSSIHADKISIEVFGDLKEIKGYFVTNSANNVLWAEYINCNLKTVGTLTIEPEFSVF